MIYELVYIFVCTLLAYINYRVIVADKQVYHWLNGLVHLVCWATVYLLTHNWILMIALPFIARLFFDTMLNLFRGLPLDYVPKKPKSVIDKLEKSVFDNNGVLPRAIYLVVIIVLNFLLWT